MLASSSHRRDGQYLITRFRATVGIWTWTLLLFGCAEISCATEGALSSAPSSARDEVSLSLRIDGGIGINPFKFILYSSGLAIYQRQAITGDVSFFSIILSDQEIRELFTDLNIKAFLGLREEYDLAHSKGSRMYDYLTYTIEVVDRETGRTYQTTVLGVLAEPRKAGALEANREVPSAFLRVFDRLDTYSNSRERPWFPEYVYVYVSPTKTNGGCEWPPEWEGLSSVAARSGGQEGDSGGEVGIIKAKGVRLVEIQRFLEDCQRRTGSTRVLMQGKPVTVTLGLDLPSQVK